ncbi:unnamed protein product, partial [Polarella glacialis]
MAALQDSLGMNWRSHNKDLVNDSFGPAWRKASTSPLQEGSLPLHPMERKELLCRVLHLRAPEVEKLRDSDYMEQHGYSLSVCPLPTDVAFSGKGAERGFVVRVYYEAHREARLLPALQTLGVDLGESESEAVHAASCQHFEQQMMYSKEAILHLDYRQHAAHEEICLGGYRYFPWAGQ